MRRVLSFGTLVLAVATASAQVTFSGPEYTQNFDTLNSTASTVTRPLSSSTTASVAGQEWTNNTTLPGWFASFENPSSVGTTGVANGNWVGAGVLGSPNSIPTFDTRFIRTDIGSGNVGSMYNYGLAGDTNRSLGSLNSGGQTTPIRNFYGLALTNGGTATATSFEIDYVGRQWRLGATAGGGDRLDFSYRVFTAGSFTVENLREPLTWTNLDAADFNGPITANGTGSVGPLDGTLAANSATISATATGLAWNPGDVLVVRWSDFDRTNADDGLAVDNVRLRAAVPEPASMAVLGLGLAAFRKRRRS